jgi:hypothetical protein
MIIGMKYNEIAICLQALKALAEAYERRIAVDGKPVDRGYLRWKERMYMLGAI